jgi:hypothetical protein
MNVKWLWNKCARQEIKISLLAAGVLPESQRTPLESHLARCPACRKQWKSLAHVALQLEEQGARLPRVTPSSALRNRWQSAVLGEQRHGFKHASHAKSSLVTGLLSSLSVNRMSWASVGVCWILIAFFQVTAPHPSKPSVDPASVTFQELVLALERTRPQAKPNSLSHELQPNSPVRPPAITPRSEQSDMTVPQTCMMGFVPWHGPSPTARSRSYLVSPCAVWACKSNPAA